MDLLRPMTCLYSTWPSLQTPPSVPAPHVLANLLRDVAAAHVVAVVERLVDVVDHRAEVALHGVEVDRALAVALDAVVDVGDRSLDRPVGDLHGRVLDQLAHHLELEEAAVDQHPVVTVE